MITGVPHKSTGHGMNADGVVGKSKIGSPQRTGNHKEMDIHLLVCVCVCVRERERERERECVCTCVKGLQKSLHVWFVMKRVWPILHCGFLAFLCFCIGFEKDLQWKKTSLCCPHTWDRLSAVIEGSFVVIHVFGILLSFWRHAWLLDERRCSHSE